MRKGPGPLAVAEAGERAKEGAFEYRGGDAVIATTEFALSLRGEKGGGGLTLAGYAY